MPKGLILALIAISILATGLVSAQGGWGEVAGHIAYNQTIGSTDTYYWTLVNYYNHSVGFYIMPAQLGNKTGTPTVVYSAIGCTPTSLCIVPANSTYRVDVNITLPLNASIGTTYSGYVDAMVPPNATGSGGQIGQGTAKLIAITAIPSTTTTTSSTSSSTSVTTTIYQAPTTAVTGGKESSVTTSIPATTTICFESCPTTSTTTISGTNSTIVTQEQTGNSTTISANPGGAIKTAASGSSLLLIIVVIVIIVVMAALAYMLLGRGAA